MQSIQIAMSDTNDPNVFTSRIKFLVEADENLSNLAHSLAADQIKLIREMASKV